MHKKSMIAKKVSTICLILITVIIIISFSVSIYGLEKTYTNTLGMEFVLVPSGTFTMGSPPNESHRGTSEVRHQVTISKPFYMQTTEVTLGQWHSIMGRRVLLRRKGSDNMPVTRVSWFDCMKFIKRLNKLGKEKYRLPTEAEWEYAARAGTKSPFSWGDTIDCDKAMYGNNSLKHDVCQLYVKSIKLEIISRHR